MPIYEYHCLACKRRVSFFLRKINEPVNESCPYCSSKELQRIMSRFSSPKSEEARMESLADPGKWSGLDENDPKSLARFMKKMGREMGEDLGEDFDQAVEEAAHEVDGGKRTDAGADESASVAD